ncbi:MAG: T9SS type A sorting domain-containing protein [Sphingobacteriales bacterium]|nr:MAG: T9SS type A sorting domain-containing protein [Sphingobacteriales bacterium]
MKQFLLLGAAGLLALNAGAQSTQRMVHTPDPAALVPNASQLPVKSAGPSLGNLMKTAATPFYTEGFGSGTGSTLPTGWTAQGNSAYPASWKWRNARVSGQFALPALASTTASNGWMVYDSDSIGSLNTSTPIEGWLTSPTVNCSTHPTVSLSFQQYFRRFNDSCFVEVSTNNFTTFTRFAVLPNNTVSNNGYSGANPTTTRINISSVAANQANVKFRFYYYGLEVGGSYNWLVDDVALSELDPTDVTIQKSSIIMRGENKYSLFSSYPVTMVDSAWGLTHTSNIGSTAVTPTYGYAVTRGGASVYNYSRQYALPANSVDSLVDMSEPYPGFVPNVIGSYQAAFSATVAGDATPANNVDTATFAITDSTLAVFNPRSSLSGYYLHRAPSGSTAAASNFVGIQFEIAPGKRDTFTSASVAFDSRSAAGGFVSIQIYKRNAAATGYDIVATTVERQLTSSMISAATGTVTYAPFLADNVLGAPVLESGSYVAVVQGRAIPNGNDVIVVTTEGLNTNTYGYTGYPGGIGTSLNDGGFDFSPSSLAIGVPNPPVMRVNFATRGPVGVTNTNANVTVAANPNPANNEFTVPVTLANAADVKVLLTNPVGQLVATQQLGKVAAGQTATATFNTAGLSNGIYFYTVEAGTERITNRIVVAH